MSTTRKTWLVRSVVALVATAGLVAVTTTPATAELPNDQAVVATLESGFIQVNESEFPLGDDSPICNPDGLETTINAHVGPIANGVADIHGVMTQFAPGTVVALDEANAVCANIVVGQEADGVQEGAGTGDGIWTLGSVGAHVRIFGVGPTAEALFPPEDGCSLGSEATPIVLDNLSGPVSGDGPPHQATLSASAYEVPPVPAAGNCSADAATLVNALLGLDAGPITATALEFRLSVDYTDHERDVWHSRGAHQHALVAAADLGRVFSRVGGGT